jgi:phospholipase C
MPDTASLLQQAEQECSHLPPPLPRNGSSVPAQEPGARPARPLPYQANATGRADRAAGRFWITMTNTGTASVHCAVHANQYRVDGPWQYDVAPGANIEDYFSAALFGGGKYDLSLYGPNGLRRRFVGDINAAGGKLEANASYDFSTPGHAKLVISLANRGSSAVVFTVTSNAYRGDGPWRFSVAPGATVTPSWDVQADTSGWYDFTVSVDADKLFSRTIAGHVELGVPSITG